MKNSVLQLLFGLVVLLAGAGLEELCPKILGVGFPFLLVSVPFLAANGRGWPEGIVLALAAGGLEDALSALPTMTSVSYFLVLALLSVRLGISWPTALLAYPGYQLWLVVWTNDLGGGVFARLLLSLPLGAMTAAVVGRAVLRTREVAAIDECE